MKLRRGYECLDGLCPITYDNFCALACLGNLAVSYAVVLIDRHSENDLCRLMYQQ